MTLDSLPARPATGRSRRPKRPPVESAESSGGMREARSATYAPPTGFRGIYMSVG